MTTHARQELIETLKQFITSLPLGEYEERNLYPLIELIEEAGFELQAKQSGIRGTVLTVIENKKL